MNAERDQSQFQEDRCDLASLRRTMLSRILLALLFVSWAVVPISLLRIMLIGFQPFMIFHILLLVVAPILYLLGRKRYSKSVLYAFFWTLLIFFVGVIATFGGASPAFIVSPFLIVFSDMVEGANIALKFFLIMLFSLIAIAALNLLGITRYPGDMSIDYITRWILPIVGFTTLSLWFLYQFTPIYHCFQENYERYRAVFDGVNDAIFINQEETGRIINVNDKACELFGFTKEEIRARSIGELSSGLAPYTQQNALDWIRKAALGEPQVFEWQARDKFNRLFWVEVSMRPALIRGQKSILVVVRDITERRKTEEMVRQSLQEKEILLQELYHRTKNNMQVISALLEMQIDSADNGKTKRAIQDIEFRIRVLALVNQKLYQSKNLSRIQMRDYLTELATLVQRSFGVHGEKVVLEVDVENIEAVIDVAIPCGLVLNELLTNCFKYAFPEGRKGKIHVQLNRKQNNELELAIGDNGIGVPQPFDFRAIRTLGMQLVVNIVERQLMGSVKMEVGDGLRWYISFREDLYTDRVKGHG